MFWKEKAMTSANPGGEWALFFKIILHSLVQNFNFWGYSYQGYPSNT